MPRSVRTGQRRPAWRAWVARKLSAASWTRSRSPGLARPIHVGAMVNARIARVIYGARDEKAGALGSIYDIGRDGRLNHRFEVIAGVMEPECAEIMREFFRARRAPAVRP